MELFYFTQAILLNQYLLCPKTSLAIKNQKVDSTAQVLNINAGGSLIQCTLFHLFAERIKQFIGSKPGHIIGGACYLKTA